MSAARWLVIVGLALAAACGDLAYGPNKDLTSFAFPAEHNPGLVTDLSATIVGTSISATAPFGTDVTALTSTFSTTGLAVEVGSTRQLSGVSVNDFTNTVTYTVRAEDNSTKDFTVAVTVEANPARELTAFAFLSAHNPGLATDVIAMLSGTNVSATVPFGTDVTALKAAFMTTGTSVTVAGTEQTSGVTPNDFTNNLTYSVRAADGSTTDYTVTITVAASTAKDITSLAFLSADNPNLPSDLFATINGTTITATTTRRFTEVRALKATFATTGASVTVNGMTQITGVTANDFTSPVTYKVVAADGSTQNFTVMVRAGFSKSDLATATSPGSVGVNDLNGDGIPDLVIVNKTSDVSVFLNTTPPGAATLTLSPSVAFATGANPSRLAIKDLNGDGKPDLAVVTPGPNTVSVLFNTTVPGATTPSFSPRVELATGNVPVGVVIGDVNGDGRPDLAVANEVTGTVSVFINTTATRGTTPSFFPKVDFATGNSPLGLAIGDLDGDGKPDLAVANGFGMLAVGLSVLNNTTPNGATTPTFSAKVDFATDLAPRSVAICDLNQDGRLDITMATANSTAAIWLNTSTVGMSFSPRTDLAIGSGANSLAVGDLDGDGQQDLITANQAAGTVSILLNATPAGATTPSFSTNVEYTTGVSSVSVAVGDLNQDGKTDLAVANYDPKTVSLFINQ